MKHVARTLALVVGLTAFAAQDGVAQHAQTREGFWLSAGLGYGSLGCQDCGSREGGVSGGLALGTTLSQKLLLGVATNGWYKDEGGATLTAGTLTAAVRFYPSATNGFFLLGGLGLGTMRASASSGAVSVSVSETGAGAVLGLGYDIRIAPNTSLTPFWNGFGMSFSDGDANVGQIGVGITFH